MFKPAFIMKRRFTRRSTSLCKFSWFTGSSTFIRNIAVAFLFVSGINAHAATQGTINSNSTGTIDLNYTQGLLTRITGFSDMVLGTWDQANPMTANTNICIGSTGINGFFSGNYRIRASGDGTSGNPAAFTLSNGSDQIFYNAYFNDQSGTANRQPLTGGLILPGQSSIGFFMLINMAGCVINNANLSIEVPTSELDGALGVYTGTLTLTLIPQ